jgi:uncharacterized protein (UPF0548 family)
MAAGPFWMRRPSGAAIEGLLAEQAAAAVTYAPVGGTRTADATPDGYHRDHYETHLGSAEATFDRACEAIRAWAVHRRSGLEVFPESARLADDQTVVLLTKATGLWVTACCRVVWMLDAPDAFGFGYGTLPCHPERGEEAFVVRRSPDGEVAFEIDAFSRPVHPLARLGAPVARRVQRAATLRYLAAMRDLVS